MTVIKNSPDNKDNSLKKVTLPDKEEKEAPLVKSLDSKTSINKNVKLAGVSLLVIALGVASGYTLSSKQQGSGVKQELNVDDVSSDQIEKGMTFGIDDEETFRDNAKGVLRRGGLDGEGSHHLERPGGESQNVYLTSSVIDLEKVIDREVQVWGETFSGKKAGWLMDVGRLKVLD